MVTKPPVVLTIAGSDPSGGAGIEADLKVITAHGCYGMTTITALTVQNTTGVKAVHEVPPERVLQTLRTLVEDIQPDVIKIGMLVSKDHVNAVMTMITEELQTGRKYRIILDPVMISTTGHKLVSEDCIEAILKTLIHSSYIVTPNVPEALVLLKMSTGKDFPNPKSLSDLEDLAKALKQLGAENVLLKGGHLPLTSDGIAAQTEESKIKVIDVFYDGNELLLADSHFSNTKHTHGTGCSLASAIASNVAKGFTAADAVKKACLYVAAGIKTAPGFGHGHGPINHLHSCYGLPFAPHQFVDYLISHPRVRDGWKQYTYHPFVQGLGDGTLDVEKFKSYLIQDYLFLTQFARANALAAYKSRKMDVIAKSAAIVGVVEYEMNLHIGYCESFGISKDEMEKASESMACTAYTRYVLDVGASGDYLALQIAMAPCLFGYGEIAQRLYTDPATKREGNIFLKWIENYVADEYVSAVKAGRQLLEDAVKSIGPAKIDELVDIFATATSLEERFWESALR